MLAGFIRKVYIFYSSLPILIFETYWNKITFLNLQITFLNLQIVTSFAMMQVLLLRRVVVVKDSNIVDTFSFRILSSH